MKNSLIAAIVDDDELDRYIYKKIILLTCPSCQIIDFSNGIEALEYLGKHAANASRLPDVVLLDIRMPFLNGWQYLEKYGRIKPALAKHTRHYICTASMERFDIDPESSDVYGCFMKPVSPQNMLKILHETSRTFF